MLIRVHPWYRCGVNKSKPDPFEAIWARALNRVTEGFVHDVRNKLTGIYSTNQLCLERDTEKAFPEEFALINQCASEATELLQTLMRIHEGKPQAGLHDLNSIVTDTFAILQHVLEHPTRLELQLAPAPLPVKADAFQIMRALMLLAFNVADFIPATARLTFETSENYHLPAATSPHPKSLKAPFAGLSIIPEQNMPMRKTINDDAQARVSFAQRVFEGAQGVLFVESLSENRFRYRVFLPKRKLD